MGRTLHILTLAAQVLHTSPPCVSIQTDIYEHDQYESTRSSWRNVLYN